MKKLIKVLLVIFFISTVFSSYAFAESHKEYSEKKISRIMTKFSKKENLNDSQSKELKVILKQIVKMKKNMRKLQKKAMKEVVNVMKQETFDDTHLNSIFQEIKEAQDDSHKNLIAGLKKLNSSFTLEQRMKLAKVLKRFQKHNKKKRKKHNHDHHDKN